MYAEWALISIDPQMEHEARERIMGRIAALHREQPGFSCHTFMGNRDTGEYGCLSQWKSRKEMEQAMDICLPQLQEAAAGLLTKEPVIQMFEVYEEAV